MIRGLRPAKLALLFAVLGAGVSGGLALAQEEPPTPSDPPPEVILGDDGRAEEDVPDVGEEIFATSDRGGEAFDPCAFLTAGDGEDSTPEEYRAWCNAEQRHHYIDARELAEEVIRANPRSYVGHFVLGYVHHMGEANAPRALFHFHEALALYTEHWGSPPISGAPWRWHARLLQELAFVESELEHYDTQLEYIAQYNERYDPDMLGEAAWPMMKMRRFDDARAVARAAQRSGEGWQMEIALNALCAIEFEAGDEQRSHEACRAALDLHGADPDRQSAVDFTNFAESSRSLFRLDEAEEIGLLATRAQTSWYGNPYVELAELYTREGRFPEALDMLQHVHGYRLRRPPHVQDVDRNEARRALAEFFIVVGRGDDAVRITTKAVLAPDRRGHNSRDPAQDLAVAAILDRVARRMRAEALEADVLGEAIPERVIAYGRASLERLDGWTSGRQAARALADTTRLVGIFQIGRSRSGILQPWLAGELASILGPGVTIEAIRRAREDDHREGASAYYDAFEAEASLLAGDPARAYELAQRARTSLGPAEALLRARTSAIAAQAAMEEGYPQRALAAYDEAFQIDPGIFVRLGWSVPVQIVARGGAVADEVAEVLAGSARFEIADIGLNVEVDSDATGGRACMSMSTGAVIGCAELRRNASEDADVFSARLARELVATAFAPRIDLSQTDASGLDGSNTVSHDGVRSLFDRGLPSD